MLLLDLLCFFVIALVVTFWLDKSTRHRRGAPPPSSEAAPANISDEIRALASENNARKHETPPSDELQGNKGQ